MSIEIRTCKEKEFAAAIGTIFQYFGTELDEEGTDDFRRILAADRVHAAFDGKEVVGSASSYPFQMTIPGGPVPVAGITLVGVRPTHRRQGILSKLMKQLLEHAHERGEPIAALWVAEEPIYGRFGCGMCSIGGEIRIDREHTRYRRHCDRLNASQVAHDEALKRFPPLYEQVAPYTPGMVARARDWWAVRQLSDREHDRMGAGPLVRVLFERDGEPAGYALYRHRAEFVEGRSNSTLEVREAIGIDVAATAGVWRYLFDVDLMAHIHADYIPIDHPLFFLLAEPRRLRYRAADGLWMRLVNVESALRARSFASGQQLVLEVTDSFCPWNEGCYRIEEGEVSRVTGDADLRLDVRELASTFMGGFGFAQLAQAGLLEELRPGGIACADRLFASSPAPWCPEMF
ncbi:MAG: GNAT family N-acetyltransferase [Gaiellaceae bacterium]|jgi:predicted acetyltransferase